MSYKTLHSAARIGDIVRIKELLEGDIDINEQDLFDKSTPVYAAAIAGKVKTVKFLIEKGADIHIEAEEGNTPLTGACIRGHIEIVMALVDAGAGRNKEKVKLALHMIERFKELDIWPEKHHLYPRVTKLLRELL